MSARCVLHRRSAVGPARRRGSGARAALLLALLLLPAVLAACRSGSESATPAQSPAAKPTQPAASASPTPSPPASPAAAGEPAASPAPTPTPEPAATPAPAGPVPVRVETVATGLEAPWELAIAPDGRLFLTERPGRVRVIADGQLLPEPAVVIQEVAEVGEGGLLGLALHPDFASNGYVYVYYTYRDGSGAFWNRVVRYTERDNRLIDPLVVLDGIPGASLHDGGRIAFGPDGKLYVTAGDARNPALAQDLGSLAGKILRVNPDGSVPPDNPFPGSPVWSYGHRNPQGLAWAPDGRLYATEHGPTGDLGMAAHDEVNLIEPGRNYGWPEMVGATVVGAPGDYVPPVLESGQQTWAPSGAAFVSSGRFPQWQGDLLFAGLRSRTLWRLDLSEDGRQAVALEPLFAGEFGRLRAVVEAPDGTLYLLTSNRDGRGNPSAEDDRVLRIVPDVP